MSALRLYNTLTSELEDFNPIEAGKVRLYVCGPTVYDDAHLGHARCYITWDVLVRVLGWLGYDVTYVRNVTDVDDKILNRARELGVSPAEVAEKNYASFTADMDALNTLRPAQEPKATEYIDEMRTAIQSLIDKDHAYAMPDGSVYFRTRSFEETRYMQLSKRSLDDLQSGARVDVDPGKEDPLDFALWKAAPAGDPNAWPSPWGGSGQGRPGWHIECSAMNHAVFGAQIDIHAGGADLIFPHHTNEIAQSEAWTGCVPFARYWLHNGFVNVSGEKMSKSLGNFATIKTLLKRYDANTIRHFLLSKKYRMPVDFNDESLQGSEDWLRKRKRLLKEAAERLPVTWDNPDAGVSRVQVQLSAAQQERMRAFTDCLSDDLNTPAALEKLEGQMRHLSSTDQAVETFQTVVTMLDVLGFDVAAFLAEETAADLPVDAIRTIYRELTGEWLEADQDAAVLLEKIIVMRAKAKAIKNWAQADAIRKHLTDIGIQLMDSRDGPTTWECNGAHVPA